MTRPHFPARRAIFSLIAAVGIGGGALVPAARAELTWASRKIELHADVRSTVLEGKFHFTNTGPNAVDIRKIESSCGCATAELEKRHYEPGESGDILARFTVGDHVGLQDKTIAVFSSDRDRPTMLNLVIQIPEVLRIAPMAVTWENGEATKTKFISLELLQNTAMKDITVQSTNPGIAVALKQVTPGKKYRLEVTPTRTDRLVFATLIVRCLYGEEEKSFRAYATVKPPLPTATH